MVSEQEIRELTSLLARQNRIMDQLFELSQEKQRMIILNHAEELDKLVQKEGIIVSNLKKLEDARFQHQKQLARDWDRSVSDLTASLILEAVRSSHLELWPEMKAQVEHMEHSIQQLKEINDQNNEFLSLSLEYIEEMQYLLSGDDAGTYSDKGIQEPTYETRASRNILDRKV